MQSVPITTEVVSLKPVHGEVYSIQHYAMIVSDLWQVGGFLQVLRFLPAMKLTAAI
jgi:hypothetical protein